MESENINTVGSSSNHTGKGGSKKGRKLTTLTALRKKELCKYTIENEEEAEEDKCPPVSHKIALESIQNLLNYLQQSNNVSVSSSVLLGMKDLQRQIRRKQVDSLKQASLQDYFTM